MSLTENMSCYIYGINQKSDVVTIAVYTKGRSVRLSGPNGSKPVHGSNARNVEGWKREAGLVWNLTDLIDVPVMLFNTDKDRRAFEGPKQIAEKRKKIISQSADEPLGQVHRPQLREATSVGITRTWVAR